MPSSIVPTHWRPRECTCSYYYGKPHFCNTEKTWIRHVRREARLLAGGRAARPPPHTPGIEERDGSDIEFLEEGFDDVLVLRHNNDEADDHQDDDMLDVEKGDSSQGSYDVQVTDDDRSKTYDEEPGVESGEDETPYDADEDSDNDEENQSEDFIPGSFHHSRTPTPTLSGISSKLSTLCGSPTSSDPSEDSEDRFLDEIVRKLGDPASWTESVSSSEEGSSEIDDLAEVGNMKRGFSVEQPGLPAHIELELEADAHTCAPQTTDNEVPYVYDKNEEPWNGEELLSFLLFDIKISCNVTREAHTRYVNVIKQFSSVTLYGLTAALRHLEEVTGIRHRRFDTCVNSCMAFTELVDADVCLHCHEPRYDANREPRATFDYIPLAHRLRLMYSSPSRAKTLSEYPRQCQRDFQKSGIMTDIWDGKLIKTLREKGHFTEPTDLGLVLHTDGVKLFKTRSSFHIWPLMLTMINLPLEERFKRENVILLGVIPGPNQPTDIDTFLRPLIDELKELEKGLVGIYNGFTKSYFKLRASLVVVSGDTKARELLMGAKGTNSYRYCCYCWNWGLHSGGGRRGAVYCPFHLPADLPVEATHNANFATFRETNPEELRLRTDEEWRSDAWQVFDNDDKAYGDYVGINRLTIFAELSSIVFPWAFVPDSMHMFWENCIPNLFNLWRGRFFPGTRTNQKKFEDTDNAYNIKPDVWEKIARGAERSKSSLPTSFGDAPRDICKHCHHMTASEWRNAAQLLFPICLKTAFPDPEFYHRYLDLVEAMESSTSQVPLADIASTIRTPIVQFLNHFEERYYEHRWERLSACLGQFHLLAHVADAVEWAGPMDNYAAWACERVCGLLVRSIKNRVAANRTTSLEVLRREQFYHLPFLARPQSATLIGLLGRDDDDSSTSSEDRLPSLQSIISTMIDTRLSWLERRKRRATVPAVQKSDMREALGSYSYYTAPLLFGKQVRRLGTHDRRLVLQFLIAQEFRVAMGHIPKQVTAYSRMITESGLCVRAADLLRRNSTRSASHVEYRSHTDDSTDESSVFYGRLQMLLRVDLDAHHVPLPLYLAIIRDILCVPDGRLQKVDREGSLCVISASDIIDLVGIVVNASENRYIVKKSSALLVAPEDD